MERPAFSVMDVVGEALSFAVARFGLALRVAWFPLVLLMLVDVALVSTGFAAPGQQWRVGVEGTYTLQLLQSLFTLEPVLILLILASVVLQASYMVPLIRAAAGVAEPHHGSLHLGFGVPHLRYIGGSILSVSALFLVAGVVMSLGQRFVDLNIVPLLNIQHTVFEPGSLHSIETEPVFGELNAVINSVDSVLFSFGLNLSVLDAAILAPIAILVAYAALRLFALPYVGAAQTSGGVLAPLSRSLSLSAGTNVLSMLAILLVYGGLIVGVFFVFSLASVVISVLFAASATATVALEAAMPGTMGTLVVNGIVMTVLAGATIAATTFLAALHAGIGGAIAHRAQS